MGKLVTDEEIKRLAESAGLTWAQLKAFIEVESPGRGFVGDRLLIQFEPVWFRRFEPYAPSGKWSVNKVDVQSREWAAFNDAWKINPESAMKSTSIGLPQIMGFHYERLGYPNVGAMWDSFKSGECDQVAALVRFITTDARLYNALHAQDWHQVASIYNGAAYREMAKKWGREPYDISLRKAYKKYAKMEN